MGRIEIKIKYNQDIIDEMPNSIAKKYFQTKTKGFFKIFFIIGIKKFLSDFKKETHENEIIAWEEHEDYSYLEEQKKRIDNFLDSDSKDIKDSNEFKRLESDRLIKRIARKIHGRVLKGITVRGILSKYLITVETQVL